MSSTLKNLYHILEIEPGASQEAVEMAYRRMALLYHPDVNKSPDANLHMQEVNEAYTVLRNPEKRAHYDQEQSLYHAARQDSPHREPATYTKTAPIYSNSGGPDSETRTQPAPQPVEQLITFYLSRQLFALDITDIEGVVMMQTILPDPGLPHFVEGIANIRGSETPVIDLRKNLGLPLQPMTRESRILLVKLNGARAGLIVDAVDKYVSLPKSDINYAPPINASQSQTYIKGIAKIGPQLVLWINLPFLLTQEDLLSLTTTTA